MRANLEKAVLLTHLAGVLRKPTLRCGDIHRIQTTATLVWLLLGHHEVE